MDYNKILVAGATGYLGTYLLKELKKQGYETVALARNPGKLKNLSVDKILRVEVTQSQTLKDVCNQVDYVISTVGITKQKDGLTYLDVDYQANANLLEEALRSGVKKFIYVSVLNAHLMKNLKIIQAKEKFVNHLQHSGMNYTIIRPNGFFSDMTEVLNMAKKDSVYLFGDGEYKGNPIHGADLAEFIIKNIDKSNIELNVGGPEILSQNQIAKLAFDVLNKREKIKYIPLWLKTILLYLIRLFTSSKYYGPIEFFMTVMTIHMVAPLYGKNKLKKYFNELADEK